MLDDYSKDSPQNLGEKLEKIESILGAIDDAIVQTDEKGIITWYNSVFADLVGQPNSKYLGKSLVEYLPLHQDDNAIKADNHPLNLVLKGKGKVNGVYKFLKGKEYELLNISASCFGVTQEKSGTIFIIRNITETVQAKSERTEAEELKKAYAVSINVLEDLKVQRKKAKESELVKDQLLKDQQKRTGELEDLYDATLNMMEDLQLERQKAEQLSVEARDAARAKADFLANMSHEIRTPMNAVLGFSDLLSRTDLTDKQKNYLETILSSGQLLMGLINDILDFSKLESGKLVLEKVEFDIKHLAQDVFKMIRSKLEGKKVNTYIDIQKDVHRSLKGDPTRLRQILINLLGNAVKFTDHGEIGLIIQLKNSTETEVELKLTVKDTGIGIPEDKHKAVFELFSQADTSTTRKFGGTGLGLSICKSLAEAMGGEIWIESKLGEGSEFIFTAKFEKGLTKDGGRQDTDVLRAKSVVIIDDNRMTLRILEKYCEDSGLTVLGLHEAPQGALNAMDQMIQNGNEINFIISDLMMPHMDGFELLKKIRGHESLTDAKVIAVSDDLSPDIAERVESAGFDVFIPKPIIQDDLITAITNLLADKTLVTLDKKEKISPETLTGTTKILVVEDSEPNQQLMKAYFEVLGNCQVDYVDNGQEAVDKLNENHAYDLCFMDMQMPVMGGLEATEIIRHNITKDLPIVALTAAAMKEDRDKCLAAGMNDYLSKPIDMIKLQQKIKQYSKGQ